MAKLGHRDTKFSNVFRNFKSIYLNPGEYWHLSTSCFQITRDECMHLQDDLRRIFGSFRVEVRSKGSDVLLATNTAKRYFSSKHPK